MNDLLSTIDWSRAQFALTAMYHWLFVPLTIGLSLIVAIMETIFVRTGDERWKKVTRFWMTLFGINFACGVATGIILEFEFGTNWSNYSWFVGDIFGAPLAIEGLFAFFLEATFVAVMFFGWNRVSKRFHLASTWLTAVGVCLSALWILVANAWMQNPVGMEFDPDQMRNVMSDFWGLAFNAVSMNKFFHAVTSGWALAGAFVLGVSAWMIWRNRSLEASKMSLKVGAWVGLIGILLTMWTGDGSAVQVAKVQPMKLAAMEGLYNGKPGTDLVAIGLVNVREDRHEEAEEATMAIKLPKGLSLLAKHDLNAFVPGINNLLDGYELTADGDTVFTDSYAKRIEMGREAHNALRIYEQAKKDNNTALADSSLAVLKANYKYFGYGFLNAPEDAIPPIALTFYSFRVMVGLGCYMLLIYIITLFVMYRRKDADYKPASWICWLLMLGIPASWVCSQAGWIVAEVGRQPWTIQDILPVNAAISDISSSGVELTFWIFAVLFTLMLLAEISIMLRYINKASRKGILND